MSELREPLKAYALGLLSQRAYTCAGLREKMTRWVGKKSSHGDLPPEEVDFLIARFVELGLLNDADFCRRWVEERARMRPRGQFLLTQELRSKGIPKEVLSQFWEEYGELDEMELAMRVLEKKRSHLMGEPGKVREKLYRHLASKGFSPGVIRELLDKG